MDRVGDDQSGFSLGFDPTTSTLRVVGWGFWSAEVAREFGKNVGAECRVRSVATLLLDMSQLKPMREEGQETFGNLIKTLPSFGVQQTSVVTTSHLTKLQLLRIARENASKEFVQFI